MHRENLVRKLEGKILPGRTMCRWMKLSLKYFNWKMFKNTVAVCKCQNKISQRVNKSKIILKFYKPCSSRSHFFFFFNIYNKGEIFTNLQHSIKWMWSSTRNGAQHASLQLNTACEETVIKDHTMSKCWNRTVCIFTAPQNTHTPVRVFQYALQIKSSMLQFVTSQQPNTAAWASLPCY